MILLKIKDAFLKSAPYVTWYSDRNFAFLDNINRLDFPVFMDRFVLR
jgi:hypothetical protein